MIKLFVLLNDNSLNKRTAPLKAKIEAPPEAIQNK